MDISTTAYAAGLIDGEGSITMPRQKTKSSFRSPQISVASTTYELVTFMQTHFGGHISTKRSKTHEHYKTAYQWRVTYDNALQLATLVIPYLREPSKRERALMLVTEYKSLTPRNGRYTVKQGQAKLEFEARFLST